ncbi:hypothetical protein AYO44_17100 [Planctomycetaceae bacterium SCGC AG-212-F19]|nr:hypothetical protein AYO44_17100 [Planctomycetaceae bacterium SCGC AG-212-F19]
MLLSFDLGALGVLAVDRARLLQASADGIKNGVLVREFAGLELGVDQLAVDLEFEAPAVRGNQVELANLLLVVVQQFGRQTDGLRLIVSLRTVTQFQLHETSPVLAGPAHPAASQRMISW